MDLPPKKQIVHVDSQSISRDESASGTAKWLQNQKVAVRPRQGIFGKNDTSGKGIGNSTRTYSHIFSRIKWQGRSSKPDHYGHCQNTSQTSKYANQILDGSPTCSQLSPQSITK